MTTYSIYLTYTYSKLSATFRYQSRYGLVMEYTWYIPGIYLVKTAVLTDQARDLAGAVTFTRSTHGCGTLAGPSRQSSQHPLDFLDFLQLRVTQIIVYYKKSKITALIS